MAEILPSHPHIAVLFLFSLVSLSLIWYLENSSSVEAGAGCVYVCVCVGGGGGGEGGEGAAGSGGEEGVYVA